MSDELVFYTHPMSRGRIVRWMLEEVGQLYRTEIVEYGTTMKGDDYRTINPMGKVPALTHGDVVVTEAAAICAYLADAFPAAGLAPPPGDRMRGPYYRWLLFAAGPIEAAVTNGALGVVVPDEKKRMMGYGSMADVVETLEGVLGRTEHLAGDAFTAADLYVAAQLGWGMMFGMIEERPVFQAYVGRICARPAYARAQEIDGPLPA